MVFCKTCAEAIAECSVVLKEALVSASELEPPEPTPIEVQVEVRHLLLSLSSTLKLTLTPDNSWHIIRLSILNSPCRVD